MRIDRAPDQIVPTLRKAFETPGPGAGPRAHRLPGQPEVLRERPGRGRPLERLNAWIASARDKAQTPPWRAEVWSQLFDLVIRSVRGRGGGGGGGPGRGPRPGPRPASGRRWPAAAPGPASRAGAVDSTRCFICRPDSRTSIDPQLAPRPPTRRAAGARPSGTPCSPRTAAAGTPRRLLLPPPRHSSRQT